MGRRDAILHTYTNVCIMLCDTASELRDIGMRFRNDVARRRMTAFRALVVFSLTATLAACSGGEESSGGGAGKSGPSQKQPATKVSAVTVQPKAVQVYGEYPGRVEGKQTARIIGRVNGVLLAKNYQEGSIVHQGDLLFTIDPKPYRATVNQRKAALASAKASLANSRRIYNRTKRLYEANAVSEAERDQALANFNSDQAAVQQAQANLESAQIDLGYTHVEAPITGVTSLRDIDLGSLVTANQTQLTTITQLDPVYVLFALPEDDAFARRKALAEMGKQTSDASTREATIITGTGEVFPYKGQVDFTQSTIDPDTGTVQLRAVVKNPENALMPGRYVRARIRIQTIEDALVIPNEAVSDSGQRVNVFVIGPDGKAKTQAVTLGPDTDSGRVITEGLEAGDQIITSGLGTLQPGMPVEVKPADTSSDKNSAAGGSAAGDNQKPSSNSSSADDNQ